MRKILYGFLAVFALFFVGCDEQKPVQKIEVNDTVPADVPISQSETNTTIDEVLPPEPVMEKQP